MKIIIVIKMHSMNSNQPAESSLEIKPKRLLDETRAWAYEVYFTTQGEALHTLIFGLDIEYLDRKYSHTTNSTILSSMPNRPALQQPSTLPTAIPTEPVTSMGPLLFNLRRAKAIFRKRNCSSLRLPMASATMYPY